MKYTCSECRMKFTDEIRLERHVKKAHPPKRKVSVESSADFNHVHMNFHHF